MNKYIKLDDAIDGKCPFEDVWEDCINCPLDNRADEPCKMGKWLNSLPTIDIVHCEECKHNSICNHSVQHTTRDIHTTVIGYKSVNTCSYGERIDE